MCRLRVRVTTPAAACGWPKKVNRGFIHQTVQNGWTVSIGRLVAFSLLKYQDPGLTDLANFSVLRTLHPGSLLPRYLIDSGGCFTCRQTDGEQLKAISELAAVGAALAYYKDATRCCANEIVRVRDSGRRLDFRLMFPTDNTNLHVEAKGVFGKTTIHRARRDFDKKIQKTGSGLGGFLCVSRQDGSQSYLELRDPPGERHTCIPSLEARLRFYYGVVRSMYGNAHPQFEAFTRQYRRSLLLYIGSGEWAPPGNGFLALGAQTIRGQLYKGREFDRRLSPDAIRTFAGWEQACEAIPAPYFFTGVALPVLLFVANGSPEALVRWQDAEGDVDDGYVSGAGVIHLELRRPPTADTERYSRNTFAELRRKVEAKREGVRRHWPTRQ